MRNLTSALDEARFQMELAGRDIAQYGRAWHSAECAWALWRRGAYRKALARLERLEAEVGA